MPIVPSNCQYRKLNVKCFGLRTAYCVTCDAWAAARDARKDIFHVRSKKDKAPSQEILTESLTQRRNEGKDAKKIFLGFILLEALSVEGAGIFARWYALTLCDGAKGLQTTRTNVSYFVCVVKGGGGA
jgi:hypothetical protein